MNSKLRKIINNYGVLKQLKYFQSEVYELNESIIDKELDKGNPIQVVVEIINKVLEGKDSKIEHITEELADVMVMLKQFQLYYNISTDDIKKVMNQKIDRQLKRIDTDKVVVKITDNGISYSKDGITAFSIGGNE